MNLSHQGISVVIPAKNRAKHLPACLKSILNQTHLPDEIIVVDDQSTDETKAVVESFQNKGVKYIKNLRSPGAQGARNQGIVSATYQWIAFQDSDDLWLPSKLELQFVQLKEKNFKTDLVIHTAGFKVVPEKNEKTLIKQEIMEGNCFEKLLLKQGPLFPTILVHKSSLEEMGLLDEQCVSFQEWDTAIRLAQKNRFIFLRQPLFEWICHSDETISKNLKRDVQGHFYILNKNKENILNIHGSKIWFSMMTDLICKTQRFGLIDEFNDYYLELPVVTRFLAKRLLKGSKPIRGTHRILQLSNKLFG